MTLLATASNLSTNCHALTTKSPTCEQVSLYPCSYTDFYWFYLYRLEREAQLAKEAAERLAAAAKKRKRASILNQKNRHKKKLL